MTIASVASAIAQGYSISKIIKSVLNMNTPLAKSIKEALKQGYNEDQIGEYLSKGKNLSFSQKNQMLTGMTEEEKARGIAYRQTKSEKNIGNILKTAATAIPVAAAGYAAGPMLGAALGRAAPSIFGPGAIPGAATTAIGGIPPAGPPPGTTPQNTINIQGTRLPSNAPPGTPPISPVAQTQPQPVAQPQAININPAEVLEKLQSKTKVDELAKSGNDAASITGFFQKFYPKIVKDVEKEAGKDFENVISDYLINRPKEAEKPPEIQPEIAEEIETPKIEKKSIVATPNGLGEVLEIRNGQAIVEVDGKKHKVSEDELISSPLGHKDLADLYDDLIGGIEKTTGQQVSRNVEWAGYDPKTNELAYKPHGSDKLYAYEDISPEDADLLTSFLTQRKSTGENFIGAWEAGTTSPIGAAMYQLIQKLQKERGGKGNEYKNRYDTLYDALEPAKKAAKERHAERKKKAKKPRTH
jgi:hypothetical protein